MQGTVEIFAFVALMLLLTMLSVAAIARVWLGILAMRRSIHIEREIWTRYVIDAAREGRQRNEQKAVDRLTRPR